MEVEGLKSSDLLQFINVLYFWFLDLDAVLFELKGVIGHSSLLF